MHTHARPFSCPFNLKKLQYNNNELSLMIPWSLQVCVVHLGVKKKICDAPKFDFLIEGVMLFYKNWEGLLLKLFVALFKF